MKNRIAPVAGLFACFLFYSAILISAYSYVGKQGESYNVLNHFISDLGDPRYSVCHTVFNTCLILSGISFFIFSYSLGGLIKTKLARLSIIIGMIASVLCSLVGVFPSHLLWTHLIIAFSFFVLMTLALTLYSYCIWKNPDQPFPKYLGLYGFCSPVAFFIFIFLPKDLLAIEREQGVIFNRPDIWGIAVGEWGVFFFLTSWVVFTSIYMIWKRIGR